MGYCARKIYGISESAKNVKRTGKICRIRAAKFAEFDTFFAECMDAAEFALSTVTVNHT